MDQVNTRDEGITVLSGGVEPVADLVFVHGIQGHPEKTWTYSENQIEPNRSGHRVVRMFSRKKQSQEEGSNETSHLFWPKDLLAKDFPNSRVLTYGYDSQVSKFFKGPANQSGILAHGESLMRALEVQRRGCRQRPIIFLVHSLGGIILKQALFRSKNAMEEDQDLRDIYQSTYSIIFFGTPHRGSSYAQMGVLARDIAVAAGFDARDSLIRSLKPDAEVLSFLRDEFARMLYDRAFKIYSFQEGQGFKGIYSLSRKIVDDESSRLDDAREGRDFINANHMMMCRFRDKNDEGYNKVKSVVSKYMDEIQTQAVQELHRHEQEQQLLIEKAAKEEEARLDRERKLLVKEICRSLRTARMNERVGEVKTAYTHTFDWAFTNPKTGFLDWLHSNKSLFWITGKPGSGKSTLMKYLLNDSRTREVLSKQGRPILSTPAFFFHSRGVETEKSFDGLLRSIIFQLLSDIPRLVDSVADIYRSYLDENSIFPWTIPQLEKALDNIRQQHIEGCICIFIDALDEYSGRSEDIARFVKQLAAPMDDNQKLILRVCASSRPWTAFTSLLNETPSFTIQDWTKEDIRKFTIDRLEGCNRDNTSFIVNDITHRAEGVFLWVALVLDELWQPLCDGKPMEDVRSLLSSLPTDLPEFYKRMIENLPKEDRPILMGMLELVLCSEYQERGIKFPAFCLAIDLLQRSPSVENEISLKPADDQRRQREVERRIRACSGGLLEVAGPRIAFRVQFVHQTVKSFIGDAQSSSILNGKSTRDMAIRGMERMMRLIIALIPQMDSTRGWKGFEPEEWPGPKQWQDFARFLLRSGFDPNIVLEVDVSPDYKHLMNNFYRDDGESDEENDKEDTNEDEDEDEDEDEVEEDSNKGESIISEDQDLDAPENLQPITAMHLALAIACSSDLEHSDHVISHLEMLAILATGGGNANVLNYRNYWSHRKGDATERSALHYLLSSFHAYAMPFQSLESDVNRALSQCIVAFLNHGADPNAVDSNGVSILELALRICPRTLIELMLEKGAQVTPKLLSKSGAPRNNADGILHELRWRRPECYTPKARAIARKHNPDWTDLEAEKQDSQQEQVLWQNAGNALNTVGGYLARLVKRRP
ncbi:hypothetical protein EG329_011557 [Mollisiaceae sp. DMI_Dod_QoI]|nr:hypothetical protein EG329_011557 [Helotiales sp. DMI_Dod_QoI]